MPVPTSRARGLSVVGIGLVSLLLFSCSPKSEPPPSTTSLEKQKPEQPKIGIPKEEKKAEPVEEKPKEEITKKEPPKEEKPAEEKKAEPVVESPKEEKKSELPQEVKPAEEKKTEQPQEIKPEEKKPEEPPKVEKPVEEKKQEEAPKKIAIKPAPAVTQKFMGVEACKTCHVGFTKGDQYNKWKTWKMAKAFEALGTQNANAIAQKYGLAYPQQQGECLQCHTTANGVPQKMVGKKFDAKMGVQCESCHGPAEKHISNMMDDTANPKAIEIPTKQTCVQCHNADNPNSANDKFWDAKNNDFLFDEAMKEIDHHGPKK